MSRLQRNDKTFLRRKPESSSSKTPRRIISAVHYNLNGDSCDVQRHKKCVSTATAIIQEPPVRTYVSSYYIAIGGISSSESKSDVHTSYTSGRRSRDRFSSSFDRDPDWDFDRKETVIDVTKRQESESSYTPYRSGRKDSYSSDYKGSDLYSSDSRNRRDSYSSYSSDTQSSNLSSYDTRHSQRQSGNTYSSFRNQQEYGQDSDASYPPSDTRSSQLEYSSVLEDSYRKTRRDSSNLSRDSRRDSGLSAYEIKKDSGLSSYGTRKDSGLYGYEARRDSGTSGYETRRDSGISGLETRRDSGVSYDTRRGSETSSFETRRESDSSSLYSSRMKKETVDSYKKQVDQHVQSSIRTEELDIAAITSSSPKTSSAATEEKRPEFIIKPRKQFCDVGKVVKFKASFEGKATLRWERYGQPIVQNDKYKLYHSLDFNYLEINSVELSDAGIYICIVENSAGCDTASAVLEVFEDYKRTPPPPPKRPQVEIPLQNIDATEGATNIEMKCKFSNVSSVNWFKDSDKLAPSQDIKSVFDGFNAVLILKNVTAKSIGCYECIATSSKGEEVQTSCVLTVHLSKPKIEPPIFIRELQDIQCNEGYPLEMVVQVKEDQKKHDDSPEILELIPSVLSVKSGEAAKFSVRHTGEKVKWYRGRQEVEADDRLIIENKPGFCEFTIQNTLPTDKGSYNVVVTNGMGNDSGIVKLVVEDESIFDNLDVKISSANFEDFYILKEIVGSGRFGVVHKCIEKSSNRLWAAKIIKCKEKKKDEFRNEIQIMNKLTHPKVLRLWDAYESPTGFVIITEFVCGGELFKRIVDDDFVLTEQDCVHFVHQICEGVRYLHDKQIVHLDLKPENILCIAKSNNFIKIIDFGLARRLQEGDSIKVLSGTPDFIAPEVVNYDEISFATDLWSLGVICYVLISGLAPFTGETNVETLSNVTQAIYDFEEETFDDISDSAKDFISKLLVKKKENRMTIHKCLQHEWLHLDHIDNQCMKRLSTDKLKNFIAKRKWQKNGTAVRALNHIAGRFTERNSSPSPTSSEPKSYSLPSQYSTFQARRSAFEKSSNH
ncbi:myosin light chain kinase, smooth muscle-like isoform X4 [Argonauta hians]